MKIIPTLLLILLPLLNVLAEISVSGNTMVRPRLHISSEYDLDGVQQTTVIDNYWLHRFHIDLKAEMGNGYLWAARLSHESPAMLTIMGNPGEGQTDWMLLYFGKRFRNGDLFAGRVPLRFTPLQDLHNYPDIAASLPWLIDNLSVTGVKGSLKIGRGSLKAFFSLDEDNAFMSIDSDSVTTWRDGYSCGLSHDLEFGKVQFSPQLLYSSNRTSCNALTAGLNLRTTLAGFKLTATVGLTRADADTASLPSAASGKYNGAIYHLGFSRPVGPGVLHCFHNYSPLDYDDTGKEYSSFFWLDYTWNVMKSDSGSFYIRPTWRWYKKDRGDNGYTIRNRFELTLVMEVK